MVRAAQFVLGGELLSGGVVVHYEIALEQHGNDGMVVDLTMQCSLVPTLLSVLLISLQSSFIGKKFYDYDFYFDHQKIMFRHDCTYVRLLSQVLDTTAAIALRWGLRNAT